MYEGHSDEISQDLHNQEKLDVPHLTIFKLVAQFHVPKSVIGYGT